MRVADNMLRPFWRSVFRNSLLLSLLLFIVFAALRIYGLFGPVPAPFVLLGSSVLMSLAPLVFLSKTGRDAVGMKTGWRGFWFGPLLGIVPGVLTFAAFPLLLFSFLLVVLAMDIGPRLPAGLLGYIVFLGLITAIGEELFFRGMLHASIRWVSGSRTVAAFGNAIAFGAIHIPHPGLLLNDPVWLQLTIIWVAIMFALSLLFSWARERTGSIWPAVLSHTLYNFTMTFPLVLLRSG